MSTLREAAQAVMTCWDAPEWGAAPPSLTGDLMDALRAALEQPEQEPLTEEKIRSAIYSYKATENLMGMNHVHVARAIEQAHGIKEGT